jgi:hypothetical protein
MWYDDAFIGVPSTSFYYEWKVKRCRGECQRLDVHNYNRAKQFHAYL